MAISTFGEYRNKAANPFNTIQVTKASLAVVADRLSSLWTAAPFAGATPTTAAVPTPSTAGAIPDWRAPSGTARLARVQLDQTNTPGVRGVLMLCDRLSHQGGLSGTVTTTQTTNLPTAPLTRYTSGVDVRAGFEIYSIVGTTQRTITASYTNSSNVSGRTSTAVVFGGTGFRELGRIIPMSLAEGDIGVRSVENIILNGGSTGTAGNFGVTLYRPLAMYPLTLFSSSRDHALAGNLVDVHDDACLFWMFLASGATSIGVFHATVSFIEDPV